MNRALGALLALVVIGGAAVPQVAEAKCSCHRKQVRRVSHQQSTVVYRTVQRPAVVERVVTRPAVVEERVITRPSVVTRRYVRVHKHKSGIIPGVYRKIFGG